MSCIADIDIIRYDPKELTAPPYRLLVHSISPVFAKQARHMLLVPAQAFRLRLAAMLVYTLLVNPHD